VVHQALAPVTQPQQSLSTLPSADLDPSVLPTLNANYDLALKQETDALSAAHACVAAPVTTISSLTRCMRQVINSHTTPPAAYTPRAACARLSFCSGFGACFVGKCFSAAGRSGPDCATISPVGM